MNKESRIIHSEDREREKRQKDPRTRMIRLIEKFKRDDWWEWEK